MFDRLRNTPKDRGAQLDRKKLEAWQNSRSTSNSRGVKGGDNQYQYSIRGGPPPKPPKDPNYPSDRNQNYQQNYQAPPSTLAPNSYRNSSYGRPISSVYSQPSPDAATFAAQQLRVEIGHSDPNEISPPSSPDALSPRDEPNPGDVSPIEEFPDMSQHHPRTAPTGESRSNIPTMRRERRKNSDAAMNALRESKSRERLKQQRPYGHDVRWDPRTGEPTTDAKKGRPSQVNPQEFVQGLGIQTDPPSPPQVKQAQQGQASFGDRLRRVRQPSGSPQPEPAPRPEWRGASGRTTIVAPVSDKMDVAPLKVPRKSSKRASREPVLSPVNSIGSDPATSPLSRGPGIDSRSNRKTSTHLGPQPQSPSIAVSNPPQTYPSPPLSDDTIPTTQSPAQQEFPVHPQQPPQQSLQVPSNDKAIRRKPAGGAGHQPHQSTSSSVYSQQDVHPAQRTPDTSQDGWTQPPSRFSVTTYATSHQSSTPRESFDVDENAPPIPTPPQQFTLQQQSSTTTLSNSILDRKRPVVSGYEGVSSRKNSPVEPVKISLDSPYYMTAPAQSSKPKPKPRQSSLPGASHWGENDSRLSLSSSVAAATAAADKDKSLPPAPPELQSAAAQDRVAQLNARLQALGNRRINLNTAIRQMTELMPTDNILASDAVVRRREAEKRKVETLRGELADVERESYELGLKLHRAYKRLDRDTEYEPTTLWVRRVTGA